MQNLTRNDPMYRSLLTTDGRGVFLLGRTFEDCNSRLCRLWGHPREEILGRTLLDFSPEAQPDGSPSRQAIERRLRAVAEDLPQCFEWRSRRKDGTTVDVLLSLERVVLDGEMRILGRVCDVTDLRRAESALHESEARLRQVLDNTTALIYAKDRDGRFILVNRNFLELFRLQDTDILGKTDFDLFPAKRAEEYRRNDMLVVEQKAPIDFEESAVLDDGLHTYVSSKFPLYDAQGKPYAVCGISTDITTRTRTEEALRNAALAVSSAQGSDIYRELVRYLATTLRVDYAFIGLFSDDPQVVKVIAMYACGEFLDGVQYKLAGTPCETVVGKQFRFYPSDVSKRFRGDPQLGDLGIDGYAATPLFDSSGRPLGLLAIMNRKPLTDPKLAESMLWIFSVRAATEIERMQSEEAQRMSEESYRAIFEASEDAIFVHDWGTGAIVDVNPKACEAYGYSREELRNLDVGAISSNEPPYTLEEAIKFIERAKLGEPQRFEWHRRNKDGSLHWDEVCLRAAVIAGKRRVLGFTREITERKEREEALGKSEGRLRATVEAALDCVIGMDNRGSVIEFNSAAERCFGYKRADVLGKPLADLLMPSRYRDAHREGIARYRETGTGPYLGRRIEITAMRADGTEFPAELAIGVAQGREGDIFIGYLRDITELRQAEEQRGRLEAQLRQAQKMEAIGHLSGGIAHDFNNILTSILGYIVLAQQREAELRDPKLAKYLSHATHSAERARDLIQQMLTFSRGQRGQPRALALTPLVKESVKLLGSVLPSSVEINANLSGDIPAVLLDPVHVEQVLMNLCINARDAMCGVGTIHIELRHAVDADAVCASCHQPIMGAHVELAVRDSGPGVSPDIVDRIFEPFFTTKEIGKGSGMGLATVHGIVHEHGGHIVVETSPGAGAVFRVLFPALKAPGSTLEQSIADPRAAVRPRLAGRVLVVDDERDVAEFMSDLFETWGLRVTVKTGSLDACKAFADQPHAFDLVVTDQTMPKLTGTGLAKYVLSVRPDVPVILYTGYSDSLTEQQIRDCGIRAIVKKPVDVSALFSLVKTLLPGARAAS